MTRTNSLLTLMAVILIAAPLLLPIGGKFSGSDDQAKDAIEEQGYKPWFSSVWEPPSGEVESLLFSLQAALGAGFFGYVLGRLHGRKKAASNNAS